jgi:hypothetical protein
VWNNTNREIVDPPGYMDFVAAARSVSALQYIIVKIPDTGQHYEISLKRIKPELLISWIWRSKRVLLGSVVDPNNFCRDPDPTFQIILIRILFCSGTGSTFISTNFLIKKFSSNSVRSEKFFFIGQKLRKNYSCVSVYPDVINTSGFNRPILVSRQNIF